MAALQEEIEARIEVCEPSNTVIVTGFGPFKKHNINASWEAVRRLPKSELEKELGICLLEEQIPVSYEDVGSKVPKLWDHHKPMLVIHVGVSERAIKVTLEQVAQKSGYDKMDIYGKLPPCKECCIGSSPEQRSALDLVELNDNINSTSTSIQTQLSRDAGRYLCEYTYYTSLSIDSSRTLFIHVPPLEKPYSAEQLAQGLAEIIKCLVRQLRKVAQSS